MDHGPFLYPVFSCLQYMSTLSSLKYLLHFFVNFELVRQTARMEWSVLPVAVLSCASSYASFIMLCSIFAISTVCFLA